jgi:hypothetical protein
MKPRSTVELQSLVVRCRSQHTRPCERSAQKTLPWKEKAMVNLNGGSSISPGGKRIRFICHGHAEFAHVAVGENAQRTGACSDVASQPRRSRLASAAANGAIQGGLEGISGHVAEHGK